MIVNKHALIVILTTIFLSPCDSNETSAKLSEVEMLSSYGANIKAFEQITTLGLEKLGDKKLMIIGDSDQYIDHLSEAEIKKYKLLLKDSGAKRVTINKEDPKYPVVSFLVNSSGLVTGGCSSEIIFSYLTPKQPEWADLYIYYKFNRKWHGVTNCN